MNLNQTIAIHAGGEGSGCHGENCGRPPTDKSREAGTGNGKIKDKAGKEYDVFHRTRVDEDGNTRHVYEVGDKSDWSPGGMANYYEGRGVAGADLTRSGDSVMSVHVYPEYQRKGIATALYDHIEKHIGQKLKKNWATTDDGEAFWKSRK